MSLGVNGRVPEISKNNFFFIFRVKQCKENNLDYLAMKLKAS
jgi:hypothetical protein